MSVVYFYTLRTFDFVSLPFLITDWNYTLQQMSTRLTIHHIAIQISCSFKWCGLSICLLSLNIFTRLRKLRSFQKTYPLNETFEVHLQRHSSQKTWPHGIIRGRFVPKQLTLADFYFHYRQNSKYCIRKWLKSSELVVIVFRNKDEQLSFCILF